MHTRLLALPILVFLFSVTLARASDSAVPPFEPASFGVNIDQALINPFDDPESGAVRLRREVATIFYEVRRIGGRTVRWFNDDVWTQYECGKDPDTVGNHAAACSLSSLAMERQRELYPTLRSGCDCW